MLRTVSALVLGLLVQAQASANVSASLLGYGFNPTSPPVGFSDNDLPGQEASVSSSRFFAPYGAAGPWGPAGTAYPIQYAGMAFADGASGVLRAAASASALSFSLPWRWATATASSVGVITLSGPEGQLLSADIELDYDGRLVGASSFELQLSASALGDPTRSWRVSDTFDNPGPPQDIDRSFSLTISGFNGDQFSVFQRLSVTATSQGGFGSADFSQTSVLGFRAAPGVSVVGVDGYLTAAPFEVVTTPVPEPANVALLAAGLALLATQRRRFSGR